MDEQPRTIQRQDGEHDQRRRQPCRPAGQRDDNHPRHAGISGQSGQAEISVQKLAENSNKQQEVVTESMADVLLQQGKAKKAIEVYKKLSLLDSSKIAYFAAKIDQLKEH